MSDASSEHPTAPKETSELISSKARQVIQSLPKGHRSKVEDLVQSLVCTASFSRFSGPIPSPETLSQYDKIVPGSANRIIQMAEAQADHRRKLEDCTIRGQMHQSNRGQWMALGISLTVIGASVWVTLAGRPWVGGALGGTTVVSLAGIFIVGKWQQSTDLRRKRTGQ